MTLKFNGAYDDGPDPGVPGPGVTSIGMLTEHAFGEGLTVSARLTQVRRAQRRA